MNTPIAILCALLPVAAGGAEEITFENARVRIGIGSDAVWRSVTLDGEELLHAKRKLAIAVAKIEGTWRSASRAEADGNELAVAFGGADTKLVYRVSAGGDAIAFRLAAVKGTRPSRLILLRLPVRIGERIGPRMNCAWDGERAVCLRGLNLRTDGRARAYHGGALLECLTRDAPGPRLEGAACAVVVGSPAELRAALARLAAGTDLPRNVDPESGTPAKDLPRARGSYWFLSFGAGEADRVVALCRRAHIRQVMMMSGSWCKDVGHYTFRTSRHRDLAELKRTVARLHDAGVLVGMHCFASKVSKTDAYVTPVPDRRFWTDRTAELARDVPADATALPTRTDLREWPGSPVAKRKLWEGGVAKHREVIVGDEIVAYERIGPEGEWDTFLGCRRGAWKTRPAAHAAGSTMRHYGVDGCINGYIIDQETDLLDETTDRLAGIFNAAGFDMVYFDGGEDVDRRRFRYYVSKFQAVAMGKFRRRPLIHMGTIMTHGLWHSFTRSGTVDTYLNTLRGKIIAGADVGEWPTVREHIDRSVEYMIRTRNDMLPGELGWFGIWPKGKHTAGLQLGEIEYLMGKSLGWDAPISLETSFRQMDAHPLTDGLLEIVGAYERLRRAGRAPEKTRAELREAGKDFILLPPREGADPVLLPAAVLDGAGGEGSGLRCILAERSRPAVATVWHETGTRCELALPDGAPAPAAVHLDGSPATLDAIAARRVTLTWPSLARDPAAALLRRATCRPGAAVP